MSAQEVADVRERALHHIVTGLTLEEAVDVALTEVGYTRGPSAHRANLIGHLVTKGLEARRCDVCRGKLIGTELAFGTCGHCGGRSINPTREEVNQ